MRRGRFGGGIGASSSSAPMTSGCAITGGAGRSWNGSMLSAGACSVGASASSGARAGNSADSVSPKAPFSTASISAPGALREPAGKETSVRSSGAASPRLPSDARPPLPPPRKSSPKKGTASASPSAGAAPPRSRTTATSEGRASAKAATLLRYDSAKLPSGTADAGARSTNDTVWRSGSRAAVPPECGRERTTGSANAGGGGRGSGGGAEGGASGAIGRNGRSGGAGGRPTPAQASRKSKQL